jgi:hypothetical protein
MKRLIILLILCFLIPGCRENENRHVVNSVRDTRHQGDPTSYPLFIDGGTKVVYQFGHLTPGKGLKLYFDTIPYPSGGYHIDDSLRRRLLAE